MKVTALVVKAVHVQVEVAQDTKVGKIRTMIIDEARKAFEAGEVSELLIHDSDMDDLID